MTAAKADRIIRLLAVVVGGFGLWMLVAMGVPLVFSLIHAVRQPPGDKLAITIFTFVTFAALMGCFVVIDGYCVIAAWRVWRQPPSRTNVRLLSALTATMLWLIASSSVTAVLHPSDGDAEIGNAVTLLSGMLAVAAMCFHGWLSRWLIARSSLTDRSPAPVSLQAIGLVCFLLFVGVSNFVTHRVHAAYPPLESDSAPTLVAFGGSGIAVYVVYRVLRHFLHDRVASDVAPSRAA